MIAKLEWYESDEQILTPGNFFQDLSIKSRTGHHGCWKGMESIWFIKSEIMKCLGSLGVIQLVDARHYTDRQMAQESILRLYLLKPWFR